MGAATATIMPTNHFSLHTLPLACATAHPIFDPDTRAQGPVNNLELFNDDAHALSCGRDRR